MMNLNVAGPISPLLREDKRVTKPPLRRKVSGSDVLKSLVDQRCIFHGKLSKEHEASFNTAVYGLYYSVLTGRPLYVLLLDYALKLTSDKRYPHVQSAILQHIPLTTPLNQLPKFYTEVISAYFLKSGALNHHDRLMMAFMMTTELIGQALEKLDIPRAAEIFKVATKVLCKGDDCEEDAFFLTPTKIDAWMHNYEELVDRTEECDLIDPKRFKTDRLQETAKPLNSEMTTEIEEVEPLDSEMTTETDEIRPVDSDVTLETAEIDALIQLAEQAEHRASIPIEPVASKGSETMIEPRYDDALGPADDNTRIYNERLHVLPVPVEPQEPYREDSPTRAANLLLSLQQDAVEIPQTLDEISSASEPEFEFGALDEPKTPWYTTDARVKCPDPKRGNNARTMLRSYCRSRAKKRGYDIKISLSIDFSARALGIAMDDYGDAISALPQYQQIKTEFLRRLLAAPNECEEYHFMVHNFIAPTDDKDIYDRIMLLCLLTSEAYINAIEAGKSKTYIGRFADMGGLDIVEWAPDGKSINQVLDEIKENKEALINRTSFSLLEDESFIDKSEALAGLLMLGQ